MAEDKTNSSLSSETPLKNDSDGGSSSRNSSGKQKAILPRYLRASTGSCHDFCKYGKTHSFEPKPTLPQLRRTKKAQNQKANSANSVNSSAEGLKVTAIQQSPSKSADYSEAQSSAPPEIIKEVVFLQPKEFESSPVQDSSSDKVMPKTEKKIKDSSAKSSPSTQRSQAKVSKHSSKTSQGVKPNPRRNSDIVGGERNTGIGTRRRASLQRVKEPITASLTSKPSVSKAPKSTGSTPVKTKNRTRESDDNSEEKVSEKTLHVIQMEKDDDVEPAQDGETVALPSPPSLSSSTSVSPDSHVESVQRKNLTKAKRVVSKPDAPSPVKLKFRRGRVVDIRNENNAPRRLTFRKRGLVGKNQDNKIRAKDNKDLETMHDDHSVSTPPPSSGKGYEKRTASTSKGTGRNQNKTLKKGSPVVTGAENPSPVKLKFKRGTVVNLQHDTNSPVKLGFLKGRQLRANQDSKSDAKKRNPRKNIEDGEHSTSLNPGKVVLRHQDVQEKKDAQGLFNNVIEEAASKLVESKKSKVKALVGAFETVISLQEKKPSTSTVVS